MGETNAGFLHCGDPLRATRTDPEFTAEAALVRSEGARTALLDHDTLLAGDTAAAVARVGRDSGAYWYRGWMIPAERYAALERGLRERGCALLTDAASYRRAHELPGWYETFAHLTPRSVWCARAPGEPPSAAELAGLAAPLGDGPAVVKDYVKSRKHEWHEACHVPELTDHAALAATVERLFALQEESLTGGVVLRTYENFVPGGEARVWWLDGEPLLVTAHPDTPGKTPVPELAAVRAAVRALGCRFVTTDMALRDDGVWRVVEVGDGQVSGLPSGADATELFAALAHARRAGHG
ncbi:ATP-grasp domain-containing protein [Streptomyces sp. NPDC006645]|uniref:ATP-grasp domain-containing protein n=1 Tax=unclassified Streptomyces TaxID=2593676 RepID=UPI0033A53407